MTSRQQIKIAFYCGPTNWRTRIVTWVTGSKYTHVEMLLPSGECVGISPEGTARVRMERLELPESEWDFIEINIDKQQLTRIVNFFVETHGQRYDWLGMCLSYLTPFYIKHNKRFYCSQWIATALTISGVFPFMYNKINPGKLADILRIKIDNGLISGNTKEME
jgi:hypothetical protein